MALTIQEVLNNAEYNLSENGNIPLAVMIAKEQLQNANTLLKAGYSLDDDFDSSYENYKNQ